MLFLLNSVQIYLARAPVDLRQSIIAELGERLIGHTHESERAEITGSRRRRHRS